MITTIFLNTGILEIASKVNNIFALICMLGIGAFFFFRSKDGKEVDKTSLYVLCGLAVLLAAVGAWAHTKTPEDLRTKNEELLGTISELNSKISSLQDSIKVCERVRGKADEAGKNCAEITAQFAAANLKIDSLQGVAAYLKTELEKKGVATQFTSRGCNSVQYNFSGPYAVVQDLETKKWGYRSKAQSLNDVKFIYSGAARFSDGMAGVMNKDGKWGFIDEFLNLKINYQYDDAWAFKNGKAKVWEGDDERWIDKKGKKLDEVGMK